MTLGRSKIRMVVSDLDGTFLDNDSLISEANRLAVKALQDQGIRFVLATGRTHLMIREYRRQLCNEEPSIACNGALIFNEHTDEVLYSRSILEDDVSCLYHYLASNNVDFLAYSFHAVYYPFNSVRIKFFHDYNQMALSGGSTPVTLFPLEKMFIDNRLVEPIYKLFIQTDDDQIISDVKRIINQTQGLSSVQSMSANLDVMPADVSKGTAVQRLTEYYGLSIDEVAVFGDHDNDVSMMEVAGLSFGMENGSELAKSSCTHVAPPNYEDGFAQMVEKYIL
ncbi:MAG: HAD family hydrolase [Fastidiosipilaceae bacterium]|jgi:Cof subfamily protein (haloacid dehalogenase superfamily)|nr:HAD family hydrolase [Clostridiaceae bacterium]